MYDEDELLPISALQHFAFCERQWALIHLECVWEENTFTMEGRFFHERSEEYGTESRKDLRIVRGLRLRSLRLGLTGKADVVEFHRLASPEAYAVREKAGLPEGVRLCGSHGLWRPYPVEYKRGKPKLGPWDEIQLCAQAICLEEMLDTAVSEGALYYGEPKRRKEVYFNEMLRRETEHLAALVHTRTHEGKTPPAEYTRRCENCSLRDICLPKATRTGRSAHAYLEKACIVPDAHGE